jgi:hypothetical protein
MQKGTSLMVLSAVPAFLFLTEPERRPPLLDFFRSLRFACSKQKNPSIVAQVEGGTIERCFLYKQESSCLVRLGCSFVLIPRLVYYHAHS